MDEPRRASVPAIDPAISTLAFRSIAVLIVVSAIIGRGLTVALRGWRVGMDDMIARADQASATLTQLVVVAGAFLAIRLLVPTLRDRELGLWYRLGVAPVVPAVVTIVFAAATGQLGHVMTLALAVATSAIALAAAAAALAAPETRAAAIVLGLCGVGAFVQLIAHALAVRAGDTALASLFMASRWIATFGFVLDLASVLIALLWLSTKNPVRLAIHASSVVGVGMLIAFLAHRGATTLDLGGGIDVLFARMMAELSRHPRPFVPTVVSYVLEASALLLAVICAFGRSRAAFATSAVSLVLGARMSTDIPLHALALTVGALLTPLALTRLAPTPSHPPASRTDPSASVTTRAQ